MKKITKLFCIIFLLSFFLPGKMYAQKPVWSFSIRVGYDQQTIDAFGGVNAFENLVNQQFVEVNSRYNTPNVFAGTYNFHVTEFFMYSGNAGDQTSLPHPNQDYLVVYTVRTDQGFTGYNGFPNRAVLFTWPAVDMFGENGTAAVTHELGHARGEVDIYFEEVLAEKNPVNQNAYTPPGSIMFSPYSERNWDPHTVDILNSTRDTVLFHIDYLFRHFPPAIGVKASANGGQLPLSGVSVKFYPVEKYSQTVNATSLVNVSTGAQGSVLLAQDPFLYPTPDNVNFLVEATYNGVKLYQWMPYTIVQHFSFTNPGQTYYATFDFGQVSATITGPATVCQNQTVNGVHYSIGSTAGATYNWWLEGAASIVAGQGTNNVTVNFSPYFNDSNIKVGVQSNGVYKEYALLIDAITCPPPAVVITGNSTVCQGQTSLLNYFLSPAAPSGSTYNWWIEGAASIVSGQGTSGIQAQFSTSFNDAYLKVGVNSNGYYTEYRLFIDAVACAHRDAAFSLTPSPVCIYPNPFTEESGLMINGPEGESAEVALFNFLGQQVYRNNSQLLNEPVQFDNKLAEGMYIVKVKKADGNMESFKIVRK
jgi:hypothetical protein